MTESDKLWLEEKFGRIGDKVDGYNSALITVNKRIDIVEKNNSLNSKFIWMVTGGLILLGLLVGVLQFNFDRSDIKQMPKTHLSPQVDQSKQLPESEQLNHLNSMP